jgi:hypothetical protein
MFIRRTLAVLATAAALVLVSAGPAMAANPHFLSGPTFSLQGDTVTATGSVAGLGNQNVDVVLTVQASVTVLCQNPAGNIAPGQTKSFSDSATQSNLQVENGRLNFTISATAAPAGSDLTGACPNRKWTPIADDVTVHSATLEIIQPSGSGIVVLSGSDTF